MHILLSATMECMQTVDRLIKKFVPNNYNLSLSLNRSERTFNGIVTVQGTVQSGTNSITVHSKNLVIESVTFDDKTAQYSYGDNDALNITHPDIVDGPQTFVIKFNGRITDSMHGLYPCYYEHDGVKKELLATQFESHHAREVFPCVDEPEAKATYDVTLTTESNIVVLGNMPINTQTTENDKLITTFDTTPLMSSYLLAWVVGELHKKTAHTKSGVEVNVWATPAQPANNLDFALDIAVRSIDFFDEYFGTPYPLPKCDNVALPDFSSGAMENWGLVTYREIALLVDPVTASISNGHHAATIIAHELSHQWFGNLVTMKWWNDLWLNESFATMMEYIAIDAIEPDWHIWQVFASSETIAALRRDSLAGVQPVQTDVKHPDEISTLFDGAIVYAKGARLMCMLQHYIGEQAFQTGLKNYFQAHAYKNTEAADLWQSLADASKKDIASYMNRWIAQPGYPVLHVSMEDSQMILSQERLVNQSDSASDELWPITLNSNCKNMPELLEARSLRVDTHCESPTRFNIGNYAHFITHYSRPMLDRVIASLTDNVLSPIDRLQLLNEQTILARAGIISSADLIPLLNAYKDESTESVWNIISMTIGELKKFVENDNEAEAKLHQLAISLAKSQYERLGWDLIPGESQSDAKLRETVIGLMLYGEDENTIAKAVEMYHSIQLNSLSPELRAIVLIAAVRHDENESMIKSLIESYKATDSSELKQDISIGLTSSRNIDTISALLEILKDTSTVRTQDTAIWMIYLLRNKHGRTTTWRWIRDNWDWIDKTFGDDKSYDDYPRYSASALSTREQLVEYRDFFTPLRTNPTLMRAIDIGMNEIKSRVETIERDSQSVRDALLNL